MLRALLALAIALTSCGEHAPPTEPAVAPASARTLRFGVYSADKPTAVVRQFAPLLNVLAERLSKELGEPVECPIQVYASYDAGIRAIVEGDVAFARLGPASYIEATRKRPDLELLAVESNGGRKTFNGIIAVASKSDIQTIAELAGRSVAFVDERSTIGRYLAQAHLAEQGVYARDLSHYAYLGRHDVVGRAVGSGKFDAGALKERTYHRLVEDGVRLRPIGVVINATKPWVANVDQLDAKTLAILGKTLLGFDDRQSLAALGKDGFLPGSDKDYAAVREAIATNSLFFSGAPATRSKVDRPQAPSSAAERAVDAR